MCADDSSVMVARLEYKLARNALDDAVDAYADADERLRQATGRLDDAQAHLEALGEVAADV